MNKIFFALTLIMFSFFNISGIAQSSKENINVNQFKELIANDSTIVKLDVRTPEELTGPLGQIEGVINIPVQELENRINELEKFKNKKIVVICRSGNRSLRATKFLLQHDFNAVNLAGGMIEYRKSEE